MGRNLLKTLDGVVNAASKREEQKPGLHYNNTKWNPRYGGTMACGVGYSVVGGKPRERLDVAFNFFIEYTRTIKYGPSSADGI